jgi:protoporphyrinogen oxidase
MKICIIGSGLAGLSAAYFLKDKFNIEIFEKRKKTGGCLSSSKTKKGYIEDFYHHFFENDRLLISMIEELDLQNEMEWLRGSTGYHVNGKNEPLTSLPEIVKYPYMTFFEKFRLGMLTLRAGKYDLGKLDDVTAKDFIEEECGEGVYNSFFEPLLKSKSGEYSDKVSAAWLISRIAIRSNRKSGGEKLGYLKCGFESIIRSLENKITDSGCIIRTGTTVKNIEKCENDWMVNGEKFDIVINTINPQKFCTLGGPDLGEFIYQGAACMTIGLKKDVLDGLYWINMKDSAPYGAVIGHTNFVPYERYDEHIVYLASYFSGEAPEGIQENMLTDFKTRFSLKDDEILWSRIFIEEDAGPVYLTGYRSKIPGYYIDGIYYAGMFSESNYPERSMEGSIAAGKKVADMITEAYSG